MPFIHWVTTDRSFHEIDQRFALKLWDEIQRRVSSQTDMIMVYDIACWLEWRAIHDLVQRHKGRVSWLGVDFQLTEPHSEDGLRLMQWDLFQVPEEVQNMADIAYCAYILPKLASDFCGYGRKLAQAIYGISQTLRVGWIAFIDEWIYSRGDVFPIQELLAMMEYIDEHYPQKFSLGNNQDLWPSGNYLIVNRTEK